MGRKLRAQRFGLFLAGRSLPWWAVGMSLVATDIGGADLIGMHRFLPLWHRDGQLRVDRMRSGDDRRRLCLYSSSLAMPCHDNSQYLERRFSVQLRLSVAACWLVMTACNLGVMLLASSLFLKSLAGWDLPVCILSTALLVGIYTWSGGLGAVVYTDVLQGLVMIGGCLLVVLIGIQDIGGITPLIDEVHKVAISRDRDNARSRERSMTPAEFAAFTEQRNHDRPPGIRTFVTGVAHRD